MGYYKKKRYQFFKKIKRMSTLQFAMMLAFCALAGGASWGLLSGGELGRYLPASLQGAISGNAQPPVVAPESSVVAVAKPQADNRATIGVNKTRMLHKAISAEGIPIDGVALLNRQTGEVRIDFTPEATPEQQERARQIASNFQWGPTAEDAFSAAKAREDIVIYFSHERLVVLDPYMAVINEVLERKDFAKLADILGRLIDKGVISPGDYAVFVQVLAEQGIGLPSLPEPEPEPEPEPAPDPEPEPALDAPDVPEPASASEPVPETPDTVETPVPEEESQPEEEPAEPASQAIDQVQLLSETPAESVAPPVTEMIEGATSSLIHGVQHLASLDIAPNMTAAVSVSPELHGVPAALWQSMQIGSAFFHTTVTNATGTMVAAVRHGSASIYRGAEAVQQGMVHAAIAVGQGMAKAANMATASTASFTTPVSGGLLFIKDEAVHYGPYLLPW